MQLALRKKRKDSLPPLECTQQAYGEKENFAWTGNFPNMPQNDTQALSLKMDHWAEETKVPEDNFGLSTKIVFVQ